VSLGIFGDSYAQDQGQPGWVAKMIEERGAVSHGKEGLGTDWIYQQFVQHHNEYERVIVFISNFMRTCLFDAEWEMIQDLESYDDLDMGRIRAVGVAATYKKAEKTSTRLFGNDFVPEVKVLCKAKDRLRERLPLTSIITQHAMINSIKLTRPDAIVVNSFPLGKMGGMHNITKMDTDRLATRWEVSNVRKNHMSPAQNAMFFELMKKALDDESFDINSTLKADQLRRYYPASQSLEEAGLRRNGKPKR